MQIRLHPLFIAVLVAAWLLGFLGFAVALLSAVIVHEFSHALAAAHFGVKTRRLSLLPFGAEVNIDCSFLSIDKKIIILFAGAAGNIILAIISGSLLWLFPRFFLFFEIIIAANAVPAILNLLPIYPLDGGKILSLLLPESYVKYFGWASTGFFGLLLILGCVWLFNLPLLVLCITMIISINFELKNTSFVSKINAAGKNSSGRIQEVAITSGMTLFAVYKLVNTASYTKFIVIDKNNFSFYEDSLEKMLVNNNVDIKIGQVL